MPNSWRECEWGDIATLEYGRSLRGYQEAEGRFRVYGTNGPIGWHDEPLCTHPGVIIGRKGAYRGVHYSPEPFFVIDTAFYLEPKEDMDLRWAYYCLLTYDINSMDSGSAIPSTSRDAFYRLRVRVPTKRQQGAIACILGALDDKIQLNRRMNHTLEAMARAIFKSWFVDFNPVHAKAEGRDPGLPARVADLFPDSFDDSDLGEIPRGWPVIALGTKIKTTKGRSYRSSELLDSDTALVTLKSFARGGGYRPDGLKSYVGTYKTDQVVEPGELVIACTDVTQAAQVVGRPAIVRASHRFTTLVASLDTLIVRPSAADLTRAYLYFLGGTHAFASHTYAYTTGTTVLHLAKEAVPSFRFAQPSQELVKVFDHMANPVLQRVAAAATENDIIAGMRDALLPKLISGELRVPDAERILGRCV